MIKIQSMKEKPKKTLFPNMKGFCETDMKEEILKMEFRRICLQIQQNVTFS